MSYVGSFEIEGDIVVIPHVLMRARERDKSLSRKTRASDERLSANVEARVRAAIRNGRVYDQKPKPFRRIGETRLFKIPSWQRVVVDEGGELAWMIALDKPPDVIVLTVLDQAGQIRMPR